jgi:hypothetical protein
MKNLWEGIIPDDGPVDFWSFLEIGFAQGA